MTFELTTHSIDRAKERMKWNEKTLHKMTGIAIEKGNSHSNAKGNLKKYLDKLWFEYKNSSIKIYGENIFIFKGNVLITLYRIPNYLTKYVNK